MLLLQKYGRAPGDMQAEGSNLWLESQRIGSKTAEVVLTNQFPNPTPPPEPTHSQSIFPIGNGNGNEITDIGFWIIGRFQASATNDKITNH